MRWFIPGRNFASNLGRGSDWDRLPFPRLLQEDVLDIVVQPGYEPPPPSGNTWGTTDSNNDIAVRGACL